MTRQIFINILLTALFLAPFASHTTSNKGKSNNFKSASIAVEHSSQEQPVQAPVVPHSAGLKPPTQKLHVPEMEELAKIHRFHRERVKKIKKHHHKAWISAKLLLIICHLAILICAFLHVTH